MSTPQDYLTHEQLAHLVVRAWKDADFKDQLEQDPARVVKAFALEEFDVDLKYAIQIEERPADLTDEQLDGIADGSIQPLDSLSVCVC